MKKIIATILCMVIITSIALAGSVSLPEKVQMQIDSGSGFKGNYKIVISRNGDENSSSGELRYLSDGNSLTLQLANEKGKNYYYVKSNKNQDLYIDNNQYSLTGCDNYINESLVKLACKYMDLPSTMQMVFSVFNYKHNYNMETALMEKRMNDERNKILSDAFEKLKSRSDLWLEKYMNGDKSKIKIGSEAALSLNYSVPYDDFKKMLKSLALDIKQDAFLTDALKQSMPEEYSNMLSLNDLDYIDFAIDSIKIDENIKLGKTFSTKGELKSSFIELPLVDKERGIYHFKYAQELTDKGNVENISISSDSNVIDISFTVSQEDEKEVYKGVISTESKELPDNSVSYNFVFKKYEKDYVDETGKDHLDSFYELNLSNNDEKGFKQADNYNIVYSKKLSSGVAKNVSTKVNKELSIENISKNEKLQFNLDAKTTAPFEIELPTANNMVIVDFNNKKDAISVIEAIKEEVKAFCPSIEETNIYKSIFSFVDSSFDKE